MGLCGNGKRPAAKRSRLAEYFTVGDEITDLARVAGYRRVWWLVGEKRAVDGEDSQQGD